MAKHRTADVTISLYWDQRHKRWTITSSGGHHSEWLAIDTTAEVDQPAAWLLLKAIQREMESWLPMH